MTYLLSQPHDVSTGVTLLFSAILLGLIACLALEEKIHAKKSVIAVTFALVSLFVGEAFGLLPRSQVTWGGHLVNIPVFIPSVDWGVISIILGASLFVDIVSKSGLFTWVAIRLTRFSGGDPKKLLWYYGLMTVVFSAVLNNVTAMIIVGSLTAVSLDKLGRNEKLLGFLLIEGLLTNIGGLLTLISSVPNIIVGTAAGITFVEFVMTSSPFVIAATIGTIMLGAKIFDIKPLQTDEERSASAELVAGFDENDGIESKAFFWFGAVMTGLFVIVIAAASELPVIDDLGMGYVALLFAGIMLIRYKHQADRFYQAIDWDLLAFFAALFVTINVMEHALVLDLIGDGIAAIIGDGGTLGQGALLVSAAGFSSVTDNIPLAAMLAKILGGMAATAGDAGLQPGLWWAVIFGANLGGNLTPIGSASTLVAVTIMHKHALPMTFGGFVKAAIPFAAMHLALALIYVLLVL